jgi:membrane-associated phospholipid phosphatase
MRFIANLLSVLFFPLFIPIYGAFLLFSLPIFSYYPSLYVRGAYITVFTFGTIVPLLCLFILYKLKVISDMNLSNRKERFIPYFCTVISYSFCAFVLARWLAMPMFIPALMIAVATALLINTIINIWWKISAHATGVGGLFGGIVCISYKLCINPFEWIIAITLVCGLVAAARLYLNAHTPGQVVAGFLNGALCTLIIPCFSLGWLFFLF